MTPTEPREKADPTVSSVIQELDALRERLDEAPDWFSNPGATIRAAALAKEVEHLCRQASLCNDPLAVESLLAASSRCLDELQTLLGVH
jgi:phage-related baseplate assembly protein